MCEALGSTLSLYKLSMVVHSYNPSTQAVEAGGLEVWGYPSYNLRLAWGYRRLSQKQTKQWQEQQVTSQRDYPGPGTTPNPSRCHPLSSQLLFNVSPEVLQCFLVFWFLFCFDKVSSVSWMYFSESNDWNQGSPRSEKKREETMTNNSKIVKTPAYGILMTCQ